jgi:hypothetical protein
MADEELRALLRSTDRADRVRGRRMLERAGRGGTAEGLVVGDRVEIRSCLPDRERRFVGAVEGVEGDTPVIVMTRQAPSGETLRLDVTGCTRCTVTLID